MTRACTVNSANETFSFVPLCKCYSGYCFEVAVGLVGPGPGLLEMWKEEANVFMQTLHWRGRTFVSLSARPSRLLLELFLVFNQTGLEPQVTL